MEACPSQVPGTRCLEERPYSFLNHLLKVYHTSKPFNNGDKHKYRSATPTITQHTHTHTHSPPAGLLKALLYYLGKMESWVCDCRLSLLKAVTFSLRCCCCAPPPPTSTTQAHAQSALIIMLLHSVHGTGLGTQTNSDKRYILSFLFLLSLLAPRRARLVHKACRSDVAAIHI